MKNAMTYAVSLRRGTLYTAPNYSDILIPIQINHSWSEKWPVLNRLQKI